MRRTFVFSIASFFSSLAIATVVSAQSSANYTLDNTSVVPAIFDQASSNYTINGSVESIVGDSASVSYTNQHGVPLKPDVPAPTPAPTPTPTPTPTPSGGGGGGGGAINSAPNPTPTPTPTSVPDPTFDFRARTFKSHQIIRGTRTNTSLGILVNGSANGVILNDLGWNRDFPLFLGWNEVRVNAKDASGALSRTIGGSIERRLIGDVNDDHVVDDVDLSLFTRAWKKYTVDADFNEDGKVDDADLSLLVSHWGMKF